MDQGNGVGYVERGIAVPSGSIEDHDRMDIGFEGGGELVEEELHGGGVGDGQDEGEGIAGIGADGSEEVGPLVAVVLLSGGALTTLPPSMAKPPLLADPHLVLKVENYPLVRIGLRGGVQCSAQPPF